MPNQSHCARAAEHRSAIEPHHKQNRPNVSYTMPHKHNATRKPRDRDQPRHHRNVRFSQPCTVRRMSHPRNASLSHASSRWQPTNAALQPLPLIVRARVERGCLYRLRRACHSAAPRGGQAMTQRARAGSHNRRANPCSTTNVHIKHTYTHKHARTHAPRKRAQAHAQKPADDVTVTRSRTCFM